MFPLLLIQSHPSASSGNAQGLPWHLAHKEPSPDGRRDPATAISIIALLSRDLEGHENVVSVIQVWVRGCDEQRQPDLFISSLLSQNETSGTFLSYICMVWYV